MKAARTSRASLNHLERWNQVFVLGSNKAWTHRLGFPKNQGCKKKKTKKEERIAFYFGPPKIWGLFPKGSKCACMFQWLLYLSVCSVECFPQSVQKALRYQMPPQSMGTSPLLLLSPYTSCSCYPAYLWQELLSKAPHCISNASDSHFSIQGSHIDVQARSCQLSKYCRSPWPTLPLPLFFPKLTPPQPLVVKKKYIFYACRCGPHTEKDIWKIWQMCFIANVCVSVSGSHIFSARFICLIKINLGTVLRLNTECRAYSQCLLDQYLLYALYKTLKRIKGHKNTTLAQATRFQDN